MKNLYLQKIVEIEKGCKVTLNDKIFTFEGPLGKQNYDVSRIRFTFSIEDNHVVIKSWHGNRQKNDLLGTVASHIRNHAIGVVKGFKYVLRAVYVHFSINISIENNGKQVTVMNFLGSKKPAVFPVRGQSVAMPGETKEFLIIQGINLNDVSQTAAHISSFHSKQKRCDVRVFLDGIFVAERTSITQ